VKKKHGVGKRKTYAFLIDQKKENIGLIEQHKNKTNKGLHFS
jgi:hypothetical protein